MSFISSTMNIELREIAVNDTNKIVNWRNKKFVLENFINRQILTIGDHKKYFETRILAGKVKQFIIVCDSIEIGTTFLRDIDLENRKAEFGIFIGEEEYLGKGIGVKATEKILCEGFEKLKLNKIFLRVLGKNKRAIKSYIKCGFKIDGCFREDVYIDDQFEDIIFMSILKGDFKL